MELPQEQVKIDLSSDPVFQDLLQPTNRKEPGKEMSEAAIKAAAEAAGDFAPEPEKIAMPNDLGETEAAYQSTPEELIDWEDQADNALAVLEFANIMGFSFAYFRSAFDRAERSVLKQKARLFKMIKRAGANSALRGKLEEDDALADLYERWLEVQQDIEEIPFTDKEAQAIIKPLAKVMQKRSIKIGPEGALAMALLGVYSTRLTPLFFK